MDSALLTESRQKLGSVELKLPFADIRLKDHLRCDDKHHPTRSFLLPGGIGGMITVRLRVVPDVDSSFHTSSAFVVAVEGLPDDADVLFRGQLKWKSRDWANASDYPSIGGLTSAYLWLHGNGCLAQFNRNQVSDVSGTVDVYGPASAPRGVSVLKKTPLDLSFNALRSLTALADLTLRAAGRDFPAHRNVLAARSAVFLTMFTSDFKEATDKIVEVAVDCSAEVFGLFLDSLYSGALGKQSCADLIPLLELAERYMVEDLKAECVRQLLAVKVEEALLLFRATFEVAFIPKEVSRKAGEVIRSNWRAVSSSAEWVEFAAAKPDIAVALEMVL